MATTGHAGLIQGNYSGNPAVFNSTTAPAAKLRNVLWGVYSGKLMLQGGASGKNIGPLGAFYDVEYGNYLNLTTDGCSNCLTLSPEESWIIDAKIDDGKPGAGKMVVFGSRWLDSCTTSASSYTYTADYLLTQTSVGCGPIFRQAF